MSSESFWRSSLSSRPEILGGIVIPNTHRPVNSCLLTRKFAERVSSPYVSFLLPFPAFSNSLMPHFSPPQDIGRILTRSTNYGKEHGSRRNKTGMKSKDVMPTSREWPARKCSVVRSASVVLRLKSGTKLYLCNLAPIYLCVQLLNRAKSKSDPWACCQTTAWASTAMRGKPSPIL